MSFIRVVVPVRRVKMSSGWREPDDDPHICLGSSALGIVVVEPGEGLIDVDVATLKGFENAESLRIRVGVGKSLGCRRRVFSR
jgi:hypothetical protein